MRLELSFGKITHESERVGRVKEVTTLEDVFLSVDVAADELTGAIKAIGEAIEAEIKAEAQVKVVEPKKEVVAEQPQTNESKKGSYVDSITIRSVPSSLTRKEVVVRVDNIIEYRLFTDFHQLLIDTLKGDTEENAIVALMENVKGKKVTLTRVVNLDKEDIEFILLIARENTDKIKFI